jgi:hypothetical protein
VALAIHLMRDDAAVGATPLFREPAQVIHGHRNLADALRERLAVFQRDRPGNFIPALFEDVRDFAQMLTPRLSRQLPPAGQRSMGITDRLCHLRPRYGAHVGEHFARGRICHRQRRLCPMPSASKKKGPCIHGRPPMDHALELLATSAVSIENFMGGSSTCFG